MGITANRQKDTDGFGQGNPVIWRLIEDGFRYESLSPSEKAEALRLLRERVDVSLGECPIPEDHVGYGWKRPITVFMTQLVLEAFPRAKVVHLIRDGRDVMLSRLNWRMSHLHRQLNRLTVFGDPSIESYRGRPLSEDVIGEFRNEIEMHHWVTAVRVGMRGRKYAGRYLEVRYEELCREPVKELRRIFEFLELPLRPEATDWIQTHASTRAIGKWRGREQELADAIHVGEPLLTELGYVG